MEPLLYINRQITYRVLYLSSFATPCDVWHTQCHTCSVIDIPLYLLCALHFCMSVEVPQQIHTILISAHERTFGKTLPYQRSLLLHSSRIAAITFSSRSCLKYANSMTSAKSFHLVPHIPFAFPFFFKLNKLKTPKNKHSHCKQRKVQWYKKAILSKKKQKQTNKKGYLEEEALWEKQFKKNLQILRSKLIVSLIII